MRSIKPGRGLSAMAAVAGVIVAVLGIFWTIGAFASAIFFPSSWVGIISDLFSILFGILAIVLAFHYFHNASSENRFSEYDITSEKEEPDPLNELVGTKGRDTTDHVGEEGHSSLEERLELLEKLKSKGLISEAEYDSQRERILGEL